VRATPDEELTAWEAVAMALWALAVGVVCRGLDLVLLLGRPSLIRPYLAIWIAEWARSPYRWPKSFEAIREARAANKDLRELMYGETPLCTAVWLLWRAGLGRGGRLLDIGAGRGRALLGARYLGAEAVGVELRSEHVEVVRTALERAGAHLQVGQGASADLCGVTHVLLNWCAFSERSRQEITARLGQAAPGTRLLAVTRPVQPEQWATVARHRGLFTWGTERVWIQERRGP
jgi:SAM-dependent methyltransferase